MERRAHVVLAGGIAVLAAAEWLRSSGGAGWAIVTVVAGLVAATLAALRPGRRGVEVLAGACALLVTGLVGNTALEVREVECCWTALRERRLTAASAALERRLDEGVVEARRLAARGAEAAGLERGAAFAALASAVPGRGPERGVTLLAPNGEPWAWAGRHRAVPVGDTAELRALISPFYVVLEARRQTATGGTSVGSVLLAAMPRPADARASLATAFAAAHGLDVRVTGPAAAPADPDVFDYRTAAGDTLFSVVLAPPGQGEAKLAVLRAAGGVVLLCLVAALIAFLATAPAGGWRWAVLVATVWMAARAAPSIAGPLGGLFSPATFFRAVLGDFSASAPVLAITAVVVTVAGWRVWRRGLVASAIRIAATALLLLAAPFLVRYLGRGIAPPAGGVGFGLWITWQLAVAAVAMAFAVWAAALVRGREEPTRVPLAIPLAMAWAVVVGLAGLFLWAPADAWPEWYTYLWLPAIVGSVVPAPRRWALLGIAGVAGGAAALVTWGAAVEGRLALARRDIDRLGSEGDPVAVALLERLGGEVRGGTPIASAGELYRLWIESPLAAQDYPATLGLWDTAGAPLGDVPLAPLDLPPALLSALARDSLAAGEFRVERLSRVPGVHYVLVAPLDGGRRIVVGVGPRTRLLPPDRVARFLRGEPAIEPPYTIGLTLPHQPATERRAGLWERAGWSVRGERLIELPGGARHVHARVDLGTPPRLMVRGVLVVLVDLALLALAWLLSQVVAEGWRPRPPRLLVALRTSYRSRLTVALMAFFGMPVVLFGIWSFTRLTDDARRAGDLLVRQALRDAALAAGSAALETPTAGAPEMVSLGRALDADLWLYRGPRLVGASAPVLGELGLVDALLDPAVFARLGFEDETDLTAPGTAAGRSLRVGYRVVRAGPPDQQTVLAAPRLLDDERVRRQQEDLALSLILGTVAGIAAALVLAARVARGLERPVSALREAAEAVGRGTAPPPFPARVPAEFTTVVSSFQRMAGDVRRSQAAIEEARERTARVLANVATGVIAVDAGLRVTLANPQAALLLGTPLAPGDDLLRTSGLDWAPVWDDVAGFLARRPADIAEREFDIAGRRIRVQLAPLGPDPDGCVVAIDDATELSRAARVLAWGEMARQVAHEIKNPLTPIRLGIQHLVRTRGAHDDSDRTFDETTTRILAEIDRLDAIARAFSRFGAPAAERVPLEVVDLHDVAREVVQLYAPGHEPSRGSPLVRVSGSPGARAMARRDEVKEVLVNLLENARQADARTVTVRVETDGAALAVEDDGRGIAPEVLPRVFEPAFSTTSSGAGLGLAIARRLVEGWGGEIGIASEPGRGTQVWVRLRAETPSG
jgi:signal transduction histidine kinase